jgi:hypothetical protein
MNEYQLNSTLSSSLPGHDLFDCVRYHLTISKYICDYYYAEFFALRFFKVERITKLYQYHYSLGVFFVFHAV